MKCYISGVKLLLLFSPLLLSGCKSGTKPSASVNAVSLPIPSFCLDRKQQYQPISTILSRTNYIDKATAYRPIQNKQGFIKQDYNQDSKQDYIFLERKQEKSQNIRLVFCQSNKQGYQRRFPPFPIYESDLPDYQTSYQKISLKNTYLQLSDFRHEHNWGSDSTISTYYYNKALSDFELIRRETNSSSGDGLRSDTEESYFLTTKRFIKKSTCGGLEENCQPRFTIGRIIPTNIIPTLFHRGKIYKQLLPDNLKPNPHK